MKSSSKRSKRRDPRDLKWGNKQTKLNILLIAFPVSHLVKEEKKTRATWKDPIISTTKQSRDGMLYSYWFLNHSWYLTPEVTEWAALENKNNKV